jgi:integrin alpha FG-GAP repeat containing protein 1
LNIDLFLTCFDAATNQHSYVVYVNNKDAGFSFGVSGLLPDSAGQVTFADIDGDGAVDMVVPGCDAHGLCSIYVYYNLQIPLCTSKGQKDCRQVTNLCVADPRFSFSVDPDHNTIPGVRVA